MKDEYFEYHMKHLIAYLDEKKRIKREKDNERRLKLYYEDKKNKKRAEEINERSRMNYHKRKNEYMKEHEELMILREENILLRQTIEDLEEQLKNKI